MPGLRHIGFFIFILCCSLVSTSCAVEAPSAARLSEGELKVCPESPNCVASTALDDAHRVAPLIFAIPVVEGWQRLKEQIARLPRTVVVNEKAGYLHVECRSAVFGFVDDLEFYLRPGQKLVDVRSAARTGYYDFGANRQRIEKLRATLLHAGVLQ